MNKKGLILTLVLVFIFALIIGLNAKDDLVKLQKKEKERRKKTKKSVLTITNDNLKKLAKQSSAKVVKLETSNVQSGETDKNESINEEINNEKEIQEKNYWVNTKKDIENSIEFYKKKSENLQMRLNKLSSDYLIIDFPPSKRQIKADLDKTRADLKKSQEKTSYFQKKLEDFLEKARKKGIPPGWLR